MVWLIRCASGSAILHSAVRHEAEGKMLAQVNSTSGPRRIHRIAPDRSPSVLCG